METFDAKDHTRSINIGGAYKHAGLSVAVTKRNGPLPLPVPPPLDEVKTEDDPGVRLEGKTNDLVYDEEAQILDSVPDILPDVPVVMGWVDENLDIQPFSEPTADESITEEPMVEKSPAQPKPKIKRKRRSKKKE